ncbi:MAG: type II secretion system F family protein [Bacillaceae bacterium]|nr:type II secretion system F family protein [Bacillaceae bacterium]
MPLALLKSKRISRLTARHSRLPLDFQILFLNRLATLLEKGYPLVEALRLITLDPKQGEIARKVQHDLINGHAIESIFKQLGFSNIVTSFLYLSRSTGQLDSLLKKCSRILNQQKQYKDHLKKVLRYPFLLMFLLLSIMTFLHLSLLPSLQHFYQSFHGSEINGTLKIIYSFTDWIFKWLYILCITAAFLFVLWKWITLISKSVYIPCFQSSEKSSGWKQLIYLAFT